MTRMNFTRTQVGSLTLGERLKKLRGDHRVSLIEASKTTRIQAKYLEALENSDYTALPAEVYVKGFLRSYAAFLGVPEDAIIKLYERERRIEHNLGRTEPVKQQPKRPIALPNRLSLKAVSIAAALAVAAGFFVYLYLEFDAFVSEPRLAIVEPIDGASVDGNEVVLRGETDPRATVVVNDAEVVVDEKGRWSERIPLQPGLNTFVVTATNRFGKVRREERSVRAEFEAAPAPEPDDFRLSPGLTLSVRTIREAVVSVRSDGVIVYSGILPPREPLPFDAKEGFSVTTSDGSATLVSFGGVEESPVAVSGGPAEASFGGGGEPKP